MTLQHCINHSVGRFNSLWYQQWERVVHHSGNHYVLPGGPTGKRYVYLLNEEIQHYVVEYFP